MLPRCYPGQVLGRPAGLDPFPLPVDLHERAPRDLEESPCPVPGPDPELEHVRGVWHSVIAVCTDHVRVITGYMPEEDKWIEYRKRRDGP